VDPAEAYGGAVDVMRALIDSSDDIDQVLQRFEDRAAGPAGNRNMLCGLVMLCESMLLDIEELTQTPMTEILQEHARRRP
jgi:hypothetical protein